jgi:hypothetical protein
MPAIRCAYHRLEGTLDGPFQPIIKLRNLAIADVTHEGDHLALFQRQHVSKDSQHYPLVAGPDLRQSRSKQKCRIDLQRFGECRDLLKREAGLSMLDHREHVGMRNPASFATCNWLFRPSSCFSAVAISFAVLLDISRSF